MTELIEAIKQLGTPSFFDWAPICLSVIAVAVAIYIPSIIAKKQNRVAVYDKLYTAYSQLLYISAFTDSIQDYSFNRNTNIRIMRCSLV